ncbi:MAG: hypothetical protein RL839_08980 [Gammaproteobacteria bacterium]
MTSPADLFNFTLLATSGLYIGMLAYFNDLLGTKKHHIPIQWNSEPILWFLLTVFMVSMAARFAGIDPTSLGAEVWNLTATGPLLVVYIYLILKIARHAVLQQIFWVMVALSVLAVLYALGNVALAIFADGSTPLRYPERIGNLLLSLTAILCLILLWCFLVSVWTSFLKNRRIEPASIDRQTGRAKLLPPHGEGKGSLQPGSSLVADFGRRRIEDHGYKADVRITGANLNVPITVEVSNDNQRWAACEVDPEIPGDYDVPYIGSPWRYVRISNSGDTVVQIGEIYDLD